MTELKLNPKQLEVLKLIKFDPVELRKMNHQMFSIIYAIYFDSFYEKEVETFSVALKAGTVTAFYKVLRDYKITSPSTQLTNERVDVIARDLADKAITSLVTEFMSRPFTKHMSLANFSSSEASKAYIEKTLGIRLEYDAIRRKKQIDALRHYYEGMTKTLDTSVGF